MYAALPQPPPAPQTLPRLPPLPLPSVFVHQVHTAVSGADGQDDQAGRWRVRGNEFSLTVDRRSKSRMLEDLRYVHQCRPLVGSLLALKVLQVFV